MHFQNSFTAIVLDQEGWDEILRREGKSAGVPYEVPESGVISIRFPKKYRGLKLKARVFVEAVE